MAQFERSGERQAVFCARRSVALSSLRPTDGTAVCRLRMAGAELSFSELPPAGYVVELLRLMDR